MLRRLICKIRELTSPKRSINVTERSIAPQSGTNSSRKTGSA